MHLEAVGDWVQTYPGDDSARCQSSCIRTNEKSMFPRGIKRGRPSGRGCTESRLYCAYVVESGKSQQVPALISVTINRALMFSSTSQMFHYPLVEFLPDSGSLGQSSHSRVPL